MSESPSIVRGPMKVPLRYPLYTVVLMTALALAREFPAERVFKAQELLPLFLGFLVVAGLALLDFMIISFPAWAIRFHIRKRPTEERKQRLFFFSICAVFYVGCLFLLYSFRDPSVAARLQTGEWHWADFVWGCTVPLRFYWYWKACSSILEYKDA